MSNKIQLNAHSEAQIVVSVCASAHVPACVRAHAHTHTHTKAKPYVWSSRTSQIFCCV